jgi:hypothetical protein
MRILKIVSLAVLLILCAHSVNMLHICYIQAKIVNVDTNIPLLTRKNIVKMLDGQSSGWKLVGILAFISIPLFVVCSKRK